MSKWFKIITVTLTLIFCGSTLFMWGNITGYKDGKDVGIELGKTTAALEIFRTFYNICEFSHKVKFGASDYWCSPVQKL